MLAFSNDYYGLNFRAKQSVELFCAYLISAGPMAKVLVYRLASNGYFALDCGHIWDDPLEV